MPSGPRPVARPGARPGRGPRVRAAARRPTPAPPTPEVPSPTEPSPAQSGGATHRRGNLTSRAIALAVVLLVLTISYATSLRIYFAQSADIAATQAEISQRQTTIVDLQRDLARWQDDEYVRSQARARLGWVMPGETGFKVIGEDGSPLDGRAEISPARPPEAPQEAWWDKLWGSVETADKPAPAPPRPTKQPTITEKTKPGSLNTPR